MAKVTYIGTYPDGQVDDDGVAYIDQYDYRFQPKKSVDVTDEYHLEKLTGNRFFEVSGESKKDEVDAARQEAEANEVDSLKAWLEERKVPVHHKMKVETLRNLKSEYEAAQAEAQKV